MTTLQKIIKEAKSLRKKFPKRFAKWTDYVKQASGIVSKNVKTVKKKIVRKKKAIKKPVKKSVKKIVKKVRSKKPSEKVILTKIHTAKGTSKNLYNQLDKLDEAQHKHMSGHKSLGAVDQLTLKKYENILKEIEIAEYFVHYWNNSLKFPKTKNEKNNIKKTITKTKLYLKELKQHKTELKKLL